MSLPLRTKDARWDAFKPRLDGIKKTGISFARRALPFLHLREGDFKMFATYNEKTKCGLREAPYR